MRIAAILIQNVVRILSVALIVLGLLFWSGHFFNLVALHMRLGEMLCGLLCILAIVGIVEGLNTGLAVTAILWGLLVVALGMNMGKLLPGRGHELIRVLHLLAGLGAIAWSEILAARIKRKLG